MKESLKLIGLGLFFSVSLVGSAQRLSQPYVTNYDKRGYSADNQNWSVSASRDGYVYFGNDQGLLEFDGSNWRLHRMPDHGVVRSVLVGEDGNIYVGSFEEFGYWQRQPNGQLHYHSLSHNLKSKDSLHNDEIWRIIFHQGGYWFQSFSSLIIYDGQNTEIIRPGGSMVLLNSARDRLFVHLLGQGLAEIKEKRFERIEGSEAFSGHEIRMVLPIGERDFLIGVNGKGLFVWDGEGFSPWEHALQSLMEPWEFNNAVSDQEKIAIGTIGSGLFIYDRSGSLLTHLFTGNLLQNNTVLGLALDHQGNIWAALDRGIDFVNFSAGLDLYLDPFNTMGSVYTALEDGSDMLIGTNQGLYRYRYDPVRGFSAPEMVENLAGQIWDLRRIGNSVICGHNNGTSLVTGSGSVALSGINGGYMIRPYPGSGGRIWIQSTYSAFAVYEALSGGIRFLHTVEGFHEPIINFEFDHLGYLWGAHATRGLFRLRLSEDLTKVEQIRFFGMEQGIVPDRRLNTALVENRILFTNGEQLYSWDDLNDTIVPYSWLNEQAGQFKSSQQVIPIGDHRYWFIQNQEIALFEIAGGSLNLEFRYDLSMQGLFLNNRYSKIVSLRADRQLICLDNGFAILNPHNANEDHPDYAAERLSRVVASNAAGKERFLPLVSLNGEINIPYGFRNLSFVYSINNGLRHPYYRHRLAGLSDQWTAWGTISEANYTRIPPGKYELQLISKKLDGSSGPALHYRFEISPPWFQSKVALMLYLVLFLGGVVVIRMMFLARLRLHKMKIEEQESYKTQQELMQNEQELIRLKNDNLQNELKFKNIQLADYTMGIIKKNEQLLRIRRELVRQQEGSAEELNPAVKTRLLKVIERQIASEDEWNRFETHFEQTHQDYLKRLKSDYPHLTQSDLKLCAYMRLNISSKQIAQLLNISLRGVEVRRYRLRKRLNLSTEENLYEFLLRH